MNTREIAPGILALSAIDSDSVLFEGLWPVRPAGVSYNSYLIQDEKKVLIDLTRETSSQDLLKSIRAHIDPAALDYIVINHMEPDHTGALRTLLSVSKNAQIVCTDVATTMLESYYGIHDRIRVARDGERMSIGSRTLAFYHTPLVHWPETMVTFEEVSRILFSCDIFGGFGADPDTLFDDEAANPGHYVEESLRYFSNIISKFAKQSGKMIAKLKPLAAKTVAPSHGLIWRADPARIIELYELWSGYGETGGERGVTVLYASMYGNTKKAALEVVRGLESASVGASAFDVNETHLSYILPALWTNAGVVVACPTYEGTIFPALRHVLEDAGAKRFPKKQLAFLGSWSWSGGALREVASLVKPFGWKIAETMEFEGAATDEVCKRAFALGSAFGSRIKSGK